MESGEPTFNGSVLVIGGGIAGIQAALDSADRGFKVYLVEKSPSIGGRMAQLDKTFPTMDCSICILAPKMIECLRHPNIELLTYSEVEKASGSAGAFKVTVRRKPRYIDEEKCTGCGTCATKCPAKAPDEFDMKLRTRKATYRPFPQAVPNVFTIDPEHCLYFQKGICRVCEKFCQRGAIDFTQQPRDLELSVGAIIVATGFVLFDPSEIKEYGYRRLKNVLTALEFERLVSASGPTDGKLLRPSDGKTAHRVAFIQCVGSRSQVKGKPYCSSACCMYSTKESILVREHDPESEVYIFYIDLKVFGKGFQDFVDRAAKECGVNYIRARPGEVKEDPQTKDLIVWYEDILAKKVKSMTVDLVVLCTGLLPSPENGKLANMLGVRLDQHGFFKSRDLMTSPIDSETSGVLLCGYCQGPKDIPESVAQASAAAARAAEIVVSKGASWNR